MSSWTADNVDVECLALFKSSGVVAFICCLFDSIKAPVFQRVLSVLLSSINLIWNSYENLLYSVLFTENHTHRYGCRLQLFLAAGRVCAYVQDVTLATCTPMTAEPTALPTTADWVRFCEVTWALHGHRKRGGVGCRMLMTNEAWSCDSSTQLTLSEGIAALINQHCCWMYQD